MDSTNNHQKTQELQNYLKHPGEDVDIIYEKIGEQLKQRFSKDKRELIFFGGQPVSLDKTTLETKIFNFETSPHGRVIPTNYNICEKTDGVRYILIITRWGEGYFMSRLSSKGAPKFFKPSGLILANNYRSVQRKQQKDIRMFDQIVEILDGELCIDEYKVNDKQSTYKLKYLVFDILVHHRIDITEKPLRQRLEYASCFVKGNHFSMMREKNKQDHRVPFREPPYIQIQMKDFFQIHKFGNDRSKMDPKAIQFMFKVYIKALPHQNDGIIFNDMGKKYLIGNNDGYQKWKPIQLNTIDFLAVPNDNFDQKQMTSYGYDLKDKRILDLYLASKDIQTNQYRPIFEAFMIVSKDKFEEIKSLKEEKSSKSNKYVSGIIVECNYRSMQEPENLKKLYELLYSHLITKSTDYSSIKQKMKIQRNDKDQINAFKKLGNYTFQKFWNIIRIRDDRDLANNNDIALKIITTIKQNITEDNLIQVSKRYFKKIQQYDRSR